MASTAALGLVSLLAATPAAAGVTQLEPHSDVINKWRTVNAASAASALADEGGFDTGTSIAPRRKRGVTQVALTDPAPIGTPSGAAAKFFAETGKRTKLIVEVVAGGSTVARETLRPRTAADWHTVPTSLSAKAALDAELRFKAKRGKRASVSAAHVELVTSSLGGGGSTPDDDPPAGGGTPSDSQVSVFGSSTSLRVDKATPSGGIAEANLLAARNEFESFQLMVEADGAPLDNLRIDTNGGLTGPGGAVIPARNLVVYREANYEVDPADGKPRSSRKGGTGLWPDPLIPERDPYYNEDRNAFPVDLDSGEKVVAWVDVFAPTGIPAGEYTGSIVVSDATGPLETVPVSLRVANLTIPATSSLRSAFLMNPPGYFPCRAHRAVDWCYPEVEENWKLTYLYARAALQNRTTIANPVPGPFQDAPVRPHFEDYILPLLRGQDSGLAGTQAPLLTGAKMTSITAMWQCINKPGCLSGWKTLATQEGFADKFFAYVCDEPHTAQTPENWNDWGDCASNAQLAEAAWPGVQTLVTSTIDGAESAERRGDIDVTEDIDFLTPPLNMLANRDFEPNDNNQRGTYDDFLGTSPPGDGQNELWVYTYCAQFSCDELESSYFDGWGAYAIDQPATQARAMSWIAYHYDLQGELYYNTTLTLDTAWEDQYRFGGNGDGNLFYPGTPNGFRSSPAIGGTKDIPIESLRLKRIRDGREDYELLKALADRGSGATADQALSDMIGSRDVATFSTAVSQGEVDQARCAMLRGLDSAVSCS